MVLSVQARLAEHVEQAMIELDPSTGTGATFEAIFDEQLAHEAKVYEADPTGGQVSPY